MATEWDQALLQSQDYTVFQSFGWGEYKRNFGWQPWRWLARHDDHIVAMAQILVKALPAKIKIGWAPGAPVLLFPHSKSKDIPIVMQSLLDTLSRRHRRLALRFDSYLPWQAEFSYALNQSLSRPILPVNTGYSTALDLSQSHESLTHKIKPRHRSYMRQAMQEDIEWKVGRDERVKHDFVRLHHEMTQQKGLKALETNIEDVTALCAALGNSATFLTGYLKGEAVTSYLILCFGKKAFYLLAAT
ncbi:MAG: peptidoglycan bridge formation glycyltransferase FemA/FemB family protein, partial [Abitibacteriaceae bacterium]|nr:peptidoglycan bridge formation glycyltransferase FemA/FemB family protein [Abditibacteriaceae bacterium]